MNNTSESRSRAEEREDRYREERHGYGSESQREQARDNRRRDIDERRTVRRSEITERRRHLSATDSSDEEGTQPGIDSSIPVEPTEEPREQEVASDNKEPDNSSLSGASLPHSSLSDSVLSDNAEPENEESNIEECTYRYLSRKTLSRDDEEDLRSVLRDGYKTLDSILTPDLSGEIPISDIREEIPSEDRKIAKIQSLLTSVLDAADDPFIKYHLKELKNITEQCLSHYYEARNELIARFNDNMFQAEYNRFYHPYKTLSIWFDGMCLRFLVVIEDKYLSDNGQNTTEQQQNSHVSAGRRKILSYQADRIDLLESYDEYYSMSRDEFLADFAENEEYYAHRTSNMLEVLNRYESRVRNNRYDGAYFKMLQNYMRDVVSDRYEVTRVFGGFTSDISDELFEELKWSYVACCSAIFLLSEYLMPTPADPPFPYLSSDNEEYDDEEYDDEDEWEQIPSESEEEEELGPAPDVQDTNLLTVQLSQQDIQQLGEDHTCCMCTEGFVVNINVLQCPACRQYHHEHCILHHLIRRDDCPLCRHHLFNR